jgi:hypothetical protein
MLNKQYEQLPTPWNKLMSALRDTSWDRHNQILQAFLAQPDLPKLPWDGYVRLIANTSDILPSGVNGEFAKYIELPINAENPDNNEQK